MRQARIVGRSEEDGLEEYTTINPISRGMPQSSGHGSIGKVWMINRQTQHLCRISSNDVAEYAGKGYVKGGPRSK